MRLIEAEFPATSAEEDDAGAAGDVEARPSVDVRGTNTPSTGSALDRAWRELRDLKPERAGDRDRLLAAASSPDVAMRQVATRVLIDADADTAAQAWRDLLDDPSRTVRRATVDAMVDADRPTLRPLLERALGDPDAWTRWKALRGLVELGIEPSRDALTRLATDTDFRVRLEATAALRGHTALASSARSANHDSTSSGEMFEQQRHELVGREFRDPVADALEYLEPVRAGHERRRRLGRVAPK